MAKVTIDGKEYETDQLSNEAKNSLVGFQFTEMEIQRLQAMLATMQTARMAYAATLKQALDKHSSNQSAISIQGDTIQFK